MNTYYPNIYLIKTLNSLDSSRPYGRLIEYQKAGGSRQLFLPENDFQTSSAKTSWFWRPGNQPKTRNSDLNFFHIPFYIWTQYNKKIFWAIITSPKAGGWKWKWFQNLLDSNLPKKHPRFGGLEINGRYETQSWTFISHVCLHMNSVYIIWKLSWTRYRNTFKVE